MAQLHHVKEAKETCASLCAETMSDFTPKADIYLQNHALLRYKDAWSNMKALKLSAVFEAHHFSIFASFDSF